MSRQCSHFTLIHSNVCFVFISLCDSFTSCSVQPAHVCLNLRPINNFSYLVISRHPVLELISVTLTGVVAAVKQTSQPLGLCCATVQVPSLLSLSPLSQICERLVSVYLSLDTPAYPSVFGNYG